MAAIAGDVEDRRIRWNPAAQVTDDLAPERVLGRHFRVGEPFGVDTVEVSLRALHLAHSRPASSSVRIHGMTSSSIVSRVVPASKPRTARAFVVSGTRSWTSCSNG